MHWGEGWDGHVLNLRFLPSCNSRVFIRCVVSLLGLSCTHCIAYGEVTVFTLAASLDAVQEGCSAGQQMMVC
jgi:hypothetical protein